MKLAKYALRAAFAAVVLLAAALLFFDLARMRRERRTVADAAPRAGRFVRAGDITMFVQDVGPPNAPVVLLVHGTGTWSEIWRETIDPLTKHYRVVAIDLPPFGYSDKPAGADSYTTDKQARRIIGAMDSLSIPRATLVAHSVGARPAVEAALVKADRFERLVLVDPALGFSSTESANPQIEKNAPSWLQQRVLGLSPIRNALISTYGTNPFFMRRVFSSFVSIKDAVTDSRLQIILKPMDVTRTTPAYGEWLEHLMLRNDDCASATATNLSRLQMNVGLIWGDADTITPLWQGRALARLIPNANLVVLKGVGHIPYIEDPQRFNAALQSELSR